MKNPFSLPALVFCILLFLSASACADSTGLNSDSSPVSSLAVYDGEVYCLSVSQPSGYGRIFRVTGGQAKEVYSGFSIDDIYSFSGGIVLNRSPETLDTLFHKMSANQSIEALDPNTGEIIQWDYYPAEAWPAYFPFTDGTSLFVCINSDRKGTDDLSDDQYILIQYDAPGEFRKVLDMDHTGGEYPTFYSVLIEKGIFFKDKIKLTLYDYKNGAQHSTKSYLKLSEDYLNYSTLQAVLKDEKLYYLSKDSLRVYDFSDDSDEVFLAFDDPSAAYHQFILAENQLILFGADFHLIDVFDISACTRLSRFTSSVSAIEYLLNDGILYLYSPYGSREIECIDLSSGSQTVIPLK